MLERYFSNGPTAGLTNRYLQAMLAQGPVLEDVSGSPLSRDLAWQLAKYLHAGVRITGDAGMLVLHTDEMRVVLAWEDTGEAGGVDVVVRFREDDLALRPEACFYLLTREIPALFTERGIINLERLMKLQDAGLPGVWMALFNRYTAAGPAGEVREAAVAFRRAS